MDWFAILWPVYSKFEKSVEFSVISVSVNQKSKLLLAKFAQKLIFDQLSFESKSLLILNIHILLETLPNKSQILNNFDHFENATEFYANLNRVKQISDDREINTIIESFFVSKLADVKIRCYGHFLQPTVQELCKSCKMVEGKSFESFTTNVSGLTKFAYLTVRLISSVDDSKVLLTLVEVYIDRLSSNEK